MRISRVVLKNWRNFRSVDVEISDRMFLIGPNACGKSNFLDVFRFLRDIAKPGGGLQKAVETRGGLSKIRCLAARKKPDVEIEAHFEENYEGRHAWRYAIGLKQEVRGSRQPFLTYERVWKDERQVLDRPRDEDTADTPRLTQTHLEQISANKEFRPIAGFLESVSYLHLIPQLLRYPEAFAGQDIAGDPFGRSFLERVAKADKNTRRSRLKKIESALRHAVPQLTSLSDVRDERGIPHLEAVYEHWRPHGARQREDQFSDGTLRLLGLLWSLLEGDSLLLLEEPELSLHSGIVKKLPALIYRLQRERKRQVLVSTHSWELLSDKGVDVDEVVLLKPEREGTTVTKAAKDREIRALVEKGFTVGEAAIPKTEPRALEQLELFPSNHGPARSGKPSS